MKNKKNLLVSIIIPVFNDQEYLDITIASLNKQTYRDIQIIVVDDGSKEKIVLPISVHPIQLHRKENSGAPSARNAGMKFAKGEYVLFLDADVIAENTMIEYMVSALSAHPEASFAYSNQRFGKVMMKGKDFSYPALQKRNYISTMSLIRKSDCIFWDESLKRFQDWDYWLRLASSGKIGVWIDIELFSIIEKEHGISTWLPRWAYWWPFRLLPAFKENVVAYMVARKIVLDKQKKA